MTGAELITQAISYYDNTLAADAENANRRLRIRHYAQMVLDEVWGWKSWAFKYATGSVTCTSGEGSLPTDFSRFGREGLVWESTAVWTEVFQGDLKALVARNVNLTDRLFAVGAGSETTVYDTGMASTTVGASVITFDGATLPAGVTGGDWVSFLASPEVLLISTRNSDVEVTTTTPAALDHSMETYRIRRAGGPLLMIPDTGTVTLSVRYEKQAPTLADDATTIAGIPVSYHRTVLLAGTIARTQTAKNDVRIYWEKQYALGLGKMVVNEMPMAARMKQMPMAVGINNS